MGRFAPSPSGPLHFGSLVCALAAYLSARSREGQWRLRIDDLDPHRVVPGSLDHILQTLESHGLHWDEGIVFQSQQTQKYVTAFEALKSAGRLFPCSCSRKTLRGQSIYPGTCRHLTQPNTSEYAWRLRIDPQVIRFTDRYKGCISSDLQTDCGDFIVMRRDGCTAYQLATVVDDHDMGITDVIRGGDLLPSAPRQIYLFQVLGWQAPSFAHIPCAMDPCGEKLGKSTDAAGMKSDNAPQNLYRALEFLRQGPPCELQGQSVPEILEWATINWREPALAGVKDAVPPHLA